MKNIINYIAFFIIALVPFNAIAQDAFQNLGTVQLHDNAQIGFHIDLINDGVLNNNKGLAGFYSDNDIRIVSGNNRAVFYNIEIDAINDLELQTSLGLTNELSFINGKVFTPKSNLAISLDFIEYDIYAGEDDDRHVDGYASILSDNGFTFPIGDDDRLRPMIIPNQSSKNYFKGAFFYENPNTPTTFSSSFDTSIKEIFIQNINNYEFWDLDGIEETEVTLTWDIESNIALIAANIQLLRVVGWSKTTNKWEDLGQIDVTGNLDEGTITSIKFLPDNYEVLTIGSKEDSTFESVNYSITPNGDGANDYLVIPGIELQPNNNLKIYNRWGSLVYEMRNYNNSWQGIAEDGKIVLNKKEKVPTGVYFYALTFDGESRTHSGWIYVRK